MKAGGSLLKMKEVNSVIQGFSHSVIFFVHTNCEFSALRLCIFLFQNS